MNRVTHKGAVYKHATRGQCMYDYCTTNHGDPPPLKERLFLVSACAWLKISHTCVRGGDLTPTEFTAQMETVHN